MDRRELLKLAAGGVVPRLAADTLAEDGKSSAAVAPDRGGQWPPVATPGRARQWLKAALEPGDFVMAYYLRDPQPEDRRPPVPGDPFGDAPSAEKAVDGTKRIGPNPGAASSVGVGDTATIRGNAETLP
jgi:hypothetical protein